MAGASGRTLHSTHAGTECVRQARGVLFVRQPLARHRNVRRSGGARRGDLRRYPHLRKCPRSVDHEGAGVVHQVIEGGFAVRSVKLRVAERMLLVEFVKHTLNGPRHPQRTAGKQA